MKKLITFFLLASICTSSFAQEVSRKLGFGLQSSFPVFGISAKYGITENSVVQATIAPFGVSSGGGSVKLNYYGARYIYRFPGNDESNPVFDPYLFGAVGLATWKYKVAGVSSSGESFFSYSAGGGVEMIVGKKFGISAEVGYGKISAGFDVGAESG